MAGLDRMKEKIKSDALSRADEIISAAEKEADEIRRNAEKEAQAFHEKCMESGKAEAKRAHERTVSAAKMEAKKRLLAAKQEIVDEFFRRAREEILAMPTGSYEDFLIDQIVSAAGDGTEQLILSYRDREKLSLLRFVARVNTRLTEAGEKGALVLSEETVDAPAGFLLKKGDVVTNCTLDALLASKKEELEVELAAILF